MSPTEAAKLLEVAPDAAPEQLEARFLELRTRFEDKIVKAPTPGLKAKYRESLEQITAAFETLALAADGSALPVLSKQSAFSSQPSAPSGSGVPPPREASAKPATKKSGSSREFIFVALIAVAVLGAGGWWVVKTRAENAEKARVEAEAKAEIERRALAEKAEQARQADAARLATEQARRDNEARRLAEEQERARAAAAAKAEQERQETQTAEIRSALVELKLAWEAIEQDARLVERRAAQMRSDARNAPTPPAVKRAETEAAAQQAFADWFANALTRHPARVARIQAEELLSARQYDSATAALAKARTAQQNIDGEIATARKSFLTLTTSLAVKVSPAQATWEVTDAYGAIHSGTGSTNVAGLPFGPTKLTAILPGFEAKAATTTLQRDQATALEVTFVSPRLNINTLPQGATVIIEGTRRGVTPLSVELDKPGTYKMTLDLAGYRKSEQSITAKEGDTAENAVVMLNDDSGIAAFGYLRAHSKAPLTVQYVYPGGPAAEAGLQTGMIIVGIEREGAFVSPDGLSDLQIAEHLKGDPGTLLRLQVRAADGGERVITITRHRLKEVESTGLVYFAKVASSETPIEISVAGKKYLLQNQQFCVVRVPLGVLTVTMQEGRYRNTHLLTVDQKPTFYTVYTAAKKVNALQLELGEHADAITRYPKVEALATP